MLTEEQRALADGGSWVAAREEAAHQKRNWVRLTFDCNDRCVFCLDSDAHDGRMRDREEVKAQILDGRRKGAERLILSGGEPTIHPSYVDFIKLGALAGYPRIQTVTNGRMFRYREFLTRCIDAGLGEITFSIHGPNAKVHDALVGVKGAFDQEMQGLRHALDDGRVIVNIDICVNRGNVRHLVRMIELFTSMGVREYDLLHVIPFGNAWREGRDVLFYDLHEMRDELHAAFAWSKKPDMHIWLNRFPVQHCEGFHELIQDPYKLRDEIRGRKEEVERWIDTGEPLDCREPKRCGYCYLQPVCDTLERELEGFATPSADVLRVDAAALRELAPVYGGDPASGQKRRLPIAERRAFLGPEALARAAGIHTLRVVGGALEDARALVGRFDEALAIELELADYAGLDEATFGARLRRCFVRHAVDAERLLALGLEVVLALTRDNEPWLRSLGAPPPRLQLRQLTWDRLTESRELDFDPRPLLAGWTAPVAGLPACLQHGRKPPDESRVLDLGMCAPGGRPDPFRFIERFVSEHYFTRSERCVECVHVSTCKGLHVNRVRAHGFEAMQPIRAHQP